MMGRWLAGTLLSGLLLAGCAAALQPIHTQAVPEAEDDAPSLYASLRKRLRDIKTEPSAERREAMSIEAVGLGQRCDQVAPGNPLCDYGLALALGVQAKQRPATAHDGLALMVERLQRVVARDPALDHAGPERVLGLLLVHAPGWPTGPGDPETGLEFARKAAARDSGYAPNWLAVAEAADTIGDTDTRKAAAQSARGLAEQAARAGEPDAAAWQRDADKLLAK